MALINYISVMLFSYFSMHAVISPSFLVLALTGNETDQMALLEFKAKITSDPLGVMASWNKTFHFCHWHGVVCGRRHQRVTDLNLQSMKLFGFISPHVGNLSFLKAIHLQNNSFRHEIPPELGRLRRLQDLKLNNNSLSGKIPSNLSACSQLLRIDLSSNFLTGPIPEQFGGLSELRIVSLLTNNLTGSVPYSFSNFTYLTILEASRNNLDGSIPDIFSKMSNLEYLNFDGNSLSGKLPHSILNVSSILNIALAVNNIQGTLPSNLGIAFPNLESLGIDNNQLDGSVPVSISNASKLVHLGLGGNKLQGQVPSLVNLHKLERFSLAFNRLGSGGRIGDDLSFLCDLTNATSLYILQLQENNFGGILPQCTTNLSSSLDYFSVAANKLHGSFPHGFGNMVNLESLWLSENQFSGNIPTDVGKLTNLYGLYMNTNSFSGNIPASIGNITRLTELYLEENRLEGSVPSSLAHCQNLMITSLAINNLSGIISPEVFGLSSSYLILDLSQNNFTGTLPKEVGNLINLEYLDVSENMLSGEIPGTLGSCVKLEYLNMQGNFLRGPIPSSLTSLRGIQELYLSRNNLSGTIPEFLEHFPFLHALNLSYNNLEGITPREGVFKNATGTSVQGNIKLCGGIPEFQLPPCKVQHPKQRGLNKTFKLILSLVCGILGITSALVFLYICCGRMERKKQSTPSESDNIFSVSYRILHKATNGFSSANLIGVGSFGSVYKGVLHQDGTTIAVKVLNLVHRGAAKSFAAECEALKNIRHRNLLKVLSACSGFDYQGNDFKALVYEFMSNGSLEEWLHPHPETSATNERATSLMFSQRLNIAIDVSMALDYLHNHCETPIVHCDLKPSNVLLDADMVGHVGDFGLINMQSLTQLESLIIRRRSSSANILPRTSGNQSSTVKVKGTIGYAPPEYGMGNEVSTQGDVYSFGILLLEMFIAKRPTDNMFQGPLNLHNFVRKALPKQVREIVDPVLVPQDMEEESSAWVNIEDSLISILEVGVGCSAELPGERLTINNAVAEMCRIQDVNSRQIVQLR